MKKRGVHTRKTYYFDLVYIWVHTHIYTHFHTNTKEKKSYNKISYEKNEKTHRKIWTED